MYVKTNYIKINYPKNSYKIILLKIILTNLSNFQNYQEYFQDREFVWYIPILVNIIRRFSIFHSTCNFNYSKVFSSINIIQKNKHFTAFSRVYYIIFIGYTCDSSDTHNVLLFGIKIGLKIINFSYTVNLFKFNEISNILVNLLVQMLGISV